MPATNPRLNHFVDLERYPIDRLDSPEGKKLIGAAHQMMADDTLVLLPDFLRPGAVRELADELNPLEPVAHRIDYLSTPYAWLDNAGFPPDHPRGALPRRNCGTITTEQIAKDSAVVELFHFDELTEFVCRMLQYDTLYRSVCETLSIQVNTMREGDQFGWHFDTNDGVVSFMIQNADNGGGFEYEPLIRDEDDENYAGVTRILNGAQSPHQPTMLSGTLALFLGRRSIHRVAPVGPTTQPRLSLLYSYDREPGMVFPSSSCDRFLNPSNEPYRGQPASVD